MLIVCHKGSFKGPSRVLECGVSGLHRCFIKVSFKLYCVLLPRATCLTKKCGFTKLAEYPLP